MIFVTPVTHARHTHKYTHTQTHQQDDGARREAIRGVGLGYGWRLTVPETRV